MAMVSTMGWVEEALHVRDRVADAMSVVRRTTNTGLVEMRIRVEGTAGLDAILRRGRLRITFEEIENRPVGAEYFFRARGRHCVQGGVMSEFGVYAVQITRIDPIGGADRIVLATTSGWQSIVLKDQFAVGDYALYIPEAAMVPDWILEDMGLVGKLAGPEKRRVKAIKLKGCLSQGLLWLPPLDVDGAHVRARALEDAGTEVVYIAWPSPGFNYAECMGITKWRPVIPAQFQGAWLPAPKLVPWGHVENIRKLRMWISDAPTPSVAQGWDFVKLGTGEVSSTLGEGAWFDPFDGAEISVTEKVHGTCFMCTVTSDGTVMVSSKGVGGRGCSLEYNADNVYWKAYDKADVKKLALAAITSRHAQAMVDRVTVYGEVFGPGIQGGFHYGLAEPELAVFDIKLGHYDWMHREEVEELCFRYGVACVPELYRGAYSHEGVWALASGWNVIGVPGVHMREGVVVRPRPEAQYAGSRLIAKFVSSDYLTRSTGDDETEFE